MLVQHDQVSGRDTPADYTDFAHTGPGTLAGRYLRLFWQPVSLSRDLSAGRARPLRIMSEDFTLYRGEGEPPSFPRWPEFEGKGVHNEARWRPWNYFQAVENSIDEVHINFTHRDSGFAAAGLTRDIPTISAEETEYGLVQYGTHCDG